MLLNIKHYYTKLNHHHSPLIRKYIDMQRNFHQNEFFTANWSYKDISPQASLSCSSFSEVSHVAHGQEWKFPSSSTNKLCSSCSESLMLHLLNSCGDLLNLDINGIHNVLKLIKHLQIFTLKLSIYYLYWNFFLNSYINDIYSIF